MIIEKHIIQIYQALRKDSGNYISEEDWLISIFPRGEARGKIKKLPVIRRYVISTILSK